MFEKFLLYDLDDSLHLKKMFAFYVAVFHFHSFIFGCTGLCCHWAFTSRGERGYSSVAVGRLLVTVASRVAEHGL